MATRRFSISRNAVAKDVVEAAGAATVTAAMEFTVDTAQIRFKADAMKALDQIKAYIKSHNWSVG